VKRTLVTGGSGFIVSKTEGDKQLLDAYDDFWSGIETMKKMPINDFCTSEDLEVRKHYFAVRKYLNVHELVAIGIKLACSMIKPATTFGVAYCADA
jgi:hypothetical protein